MNKPQGKVTELNRPNIQKWAKIMREIYLQEIMKENDKQS